MEMEEEGLQVRGRIFDIQRYSIHDGRGIRTIVFFKGCALRCRWCCNPESQSREMETMIRQGKPAIVGRDITVAQALEEVEKDRPYYRRSGGGMTLSGGEMLCQPEFALALLREASRRGIHTAVESTAYGDFAHIQAILPYLDQYLLDIKHLDGEAHRRWTGRHNGLILENAKKIAAFALERGKPAISIRVPVIPGFNDDPVLLEAIGRFAQELGGVECIHLLPYHRLGQDKYAALGREYAMGDVRPPSRERMQLLLESVRRGAGSIGCQIGG